MYYPFNSSAYKKHCRSCAFNAFVFGYLNPTSRSGQFFYCKVYSNTSLSNVCPLISSVPFPKRTIFIPALSITYRDPILSAAHHALTVLMFFMPGTTTLRVLLRTDRINQYQFVSPFSVSFLLTIRKYTLFKFPSHTQPHFSLSSSNFKAKNTFHNSSRGSVHCFNER